MNQSALYSTSKYHMAYHREYSHYTFRLKSAIPATQAAFRNAVMLELELI